MIFEASSVFLVFFGLVSNLVTGISHNCWGDEDVADVVRRLFLSRVPHLKRAHRPVDVNRPERCCPCPEMARREAAVGVGVLRGAVRARTEPCWEAGSGAALREGLRVRAG